MHGKTAVARRGFAFCAGQGIVFMGDRVQKNREVFADRLEPLCDHLFRRRAHDDPIAVFDGQAQQDIPHGTADQVGFHAGSLATRSRRDGHPGQRLAR